MVHCILARQTQTKSIALTCVHLPSMNHLAAWLHIKISESWLIKRISSWWSECTIAQDIDYHCYFRNCFFLGGCHSEKLVPKTSSWTDLTGKPPFSHLIYPLPHQGGLGTHLTLDLQGGAKFGPDVEYLDKITFEVTESRIGGFYEEIREYWPGLPNDSLRPAFAGIRPKVRLNTFLIIIS